MLRTASKKTNDRITSKALPYFFTSIVLLLLILPVFAADKQKDEETLRKANLLLQDKLHSKDISPALLSKADCVLILPGVKKFGFGVGGGGASVGLQVGGSSSDFVLLLMNSKVVNQVLNGKTKMGTDATAAAGPGATAASASDADIPTYGRAKGVFAGVSLGGATVEPDNDANYRLYGKTVTATDIVRGTDVKPSGDGLALVTMLDSKITKHSK